MPEILIDNPNAHSDVYIDDDAMEVEVEFEAIPGGQEIQRLIDQGKAEIIETTNECIDSIPEDYSTLSTHVNTLDTSKQDKLTAGNGISIENNVISATGNDAVWGNITGTLSDQADLSAALDEKADLEDVYTKTDVYTKAEVNTIAEGKANSSDVYTKAEVNTIASGKASLDEAGKIPSSELPSYVDDVLEYESIESFPNPGESGKIYIDISDGKTYRWSGSTYVEISSSLALGETSSTAYAGDKGKANADAISGLQSNKADKSDSYTKTEVDTALSEKASASDVSSLSSTIANQDAFRFIGWNVPQELIAKGISNTVIDGVCHKKVDRVDLGSCVWEKSATSISGVYEFISSSIANSVKKVSNYDIANIYCVKYEPKSAGQTYDGAIGIAIRADGAIMCDNTTHYNSESAFKSAMNGTYLYYELATEVLINDTESMSNVELTEQRKKDINQYVEGVNLLNPTLATSTQNGITCTKNSDGTYTFNGTASAQASFVVSQYTIKARETLRVVGCPSGGSSSKYRILVGGYGYDYGSGVTFTRDADTSFSSTIQIQIMSGQTVNNLVFKPMLTEDTSLIYDDFAPYCEYSNRTLSNEIANIDDKITLTQRTLLLTVTDVESNKGYTLSENANKYKKLLFETSRGGSQVVDVDMLLALGTGSISISSYFANSTGGYVEGFNGSIAVNSGNIINFYVINRYLSGWSSSQIQIFGYK